MIKTGEKLYQKKKEEKWRQVPVKQRERKHQYSKLSLLQGLSHLEISSQLPLTPNPIHLILGVHQVIYNDIQYVIT
jgi:serine/threonine protein kinase HipA of HipAB toxin-antitoxin module